MPIARALLLLVTLASGSAWAQAIPIVHPIYVTLPGSPHDQQATKMFADALARYRIGPVETMDLPAPPAPRAAELLRTGQAAFEKLKWPEAQAAFDTGVAEVLKTGAAGVEPAQLADLFLYQAIAAQRADWKELTGPVKEIAPARAKEAYLRAATLTPDRVLAQHRFPPLAIASFALATAEVKQRPRGNLVVRAAPSAQVTIDAGQPLLAPATATGLAYGEHYVRVEDVGREPWAAVIPLTEATMEIDAPAATPLAIDDRAAAEHARRQGATYALVAQLKPGASPALDLRLLDAATAQARDATVVP